MENRHKKMIFRLVSVGLGFLAGLLILECALRLYVAGSNRKSTSTFSGLMHQAVAKINGRSKIYRNSRNHELGYELVPGASNGTISINRWGFRGGEWKEIPEKNTVRIAMLGDSELFGAALKANEVLPSLLEKTLNSFGQPNRFEVLNFGVQGYNTSQELEVLKKKALHFSPQAVLLFYVFNDPELHDRSIILHRSWMSHLYLYLYYQWLKLRLTHNQSMRIKTHGSTIDFYKKLHSSKAFDACKKMILEMNRLCKKRGIVFAMIISPEVYGYDSFEQYPYWEIQKKLRALQNYGIPVIDPLPQLINSGKTPKECWVSDTDPHKNYETNVILAKIIAEKLVMVIPGAH